MLDNVPGWLRYGMEHDQFPLMLVRGVNQSVLVMRDGTTYDLALQLANG